MSQPIVIVPDRIARKRQAGQKAGAGLWGFLATGIQRRTGGGKRRIIIDGIAVNLHQVGRQNIRNEERGGQQPS